jgi:hypothetical protein
MILKKKIIENGHFVCPICKETVLVSDYLQEVFKEDKGALWFANMVTHYRHEHITSWNKCWGYNGNNYRSGWFKDYETEKALVNERAKRQILRKCKEYILETGFDITSFLKLKHTDEKTLNLLLKTFNMEDLVTKED